MTMRSQWSIGIVLLAMSVAFGCGKSSEAPQASTAAVRTDEAAWQEVTGLATHVEGGAEIMLPGSQVWIKLEPKAEVPVGAKIRTAEGGSVDVLVAPSGAIRLKENTSVSIEQNRSGATEQEVSVKMDRGRLLHKFAAERDKELDYTVGTEIAAAAIRGTEFDAIVREGIADFRVLTGKVWVRNDAGEKEVAEKSGSSVSAGAAPSDPRTLSSTELKEVGECSLVRWTVAIQRAQRVTTLAEVRNIAQALDMHLIEHGRYPESLAAAGIDYLKDAWDNSYQYQVKNDGKSYELTSVGKDRQLGTDDDLKYSPEM